jgi:uncharacterized protein involved in exopolysaccharide biosynthesis
MTPTKPTRKPSSKRLRAEQTPFLREVVTILCIRWKTITISMGIILATGFTYLHTATKMYEAHGEVLLRQGDRQRDSATAIVRGDYGQYNISERDIKTDAEMLGSSRVVGTALVAMQQEDRMEFSHARAKRVDTSDDDLDTPLPQNRPVVPSDPTSPPVKNIIPESPFFAELTQTEEMTKAIRYAQERLTTEQVKGTRVLHVSFTHPSPEYAARFLNSLFQAYIYYRKNIETSASAAPFFQKHVKYYSDRIRQREDRKLQITKDINSATPGEEIKNNLLILKELNNRLTQVSQKYIAAEETLLAYKANETTGALDVRFYADLQNSTMNALAQEVFRAYTEMKTTGSFFKQGQGPAQASRERYRIASTLLNDEGLRYYKNLESDFTTVKKQKIEIEQRIKGIMKRNLLLHEAQQTLDRLDMENRIARQSYETFALRSEEANAQLERSRSDLYDIVILTKPRISSVPISPNPILLIPLTCFVALLVSITLGFLLEFFDPRIKRIQDIQRITDAPVLFSLNP